MAIKHLNEMTDDEIRQFFNDMSVSERHLFNLPVKGMYLEDIAAKHKRWLKKNYPDANYSPLAVATVISMFETKGFWRYHYTESQPGHKFYSVCVVISS